ncbi:putative ATP-grasp-modified RiPP [Streptomyces sp. NBC_01795]|uniref:putative ATP-grasp-modified RiPP n=1 Tax=unclassified Streptomyces TaxID=2593676 RepID=UPI002DD80D0A|nr:MULTISPECIES: putative ATP-grasp-modified RiPP [unclassified Streptomyces]WSA97215.1 putative ATP-grasp-modified RiPP [Streptomyces sp. NBC_01795]WSB81645.1 putative ATP-grasp-modified RiPP [Streptomyces sp. NBC_01775]
MRGPRARPWCVGRLAPYPTTVHRPHATVTIDPATQLGGFRDRAGHVVEMGEHGTSSGTETSTTTNSDSAPDQGHDQDNQQD